MKIGAVIMVHNMAPLIGATVRSLSWTDGIYIYDDNSDDNSTDMACRSARVPIVVERSVDPRLAFYRGEMDVRNYIIDRAFNELRCDVLICVDSDELVASAVRPIIDHTFETAVCDSIAFSTWHLYDEQTYLHFWETTINGVDMIDPHTRIIGREKRFEPLFPDGSHPIIYTTDRTLCLHGFYHFHLKYFHKSPYPNYAINFLPKWPTAKSVQPYLRTLPFTLPSNVLEAIRSIDWNELSPTDTPYYGAFQESRSEYLDPRLALIHPKDRG